MPLYGKRKRIYAYNPRKKRSPYRPTGKSGFLRARNQFPHATYSLPHSSLSQGHVALRAGYGPLGASQKVNHRYFDQALTLNAGAAAATAYRFVANGMYDPDYEVGGHQTVAFDEMCNFFDHYTVIYAKISVTCKNTDDADLLFGVYCTDSDTVETAGTKIIENGSGVWTQLIAGGTADKSLQTVTMDVNISEFMGRKHIMSEDNLRGDSAGNPSEKVYFHVWCQTVDGSDMAAVTFNVLLDQVAVWTEPKRLGIS